MVTLAVKTADSLCGAVTTIMSFAATFPTSELILTPFFGMAKLLALEASQRVWDVWLNVHYIVTNFEFSWWDVRIES